MQEKQQHLCRNCGKQLRSTRPHDHLRWAVFCSADCRSHWNSEQYKQRNPRPKNPSGTTGAIAELIVAADLLKRGFEVFRAVSPSCSCDLAIMKDKKLIRVEVTTGYITPNGKIYQPKQPRHFHKFDLLGIYVTALGVVNYLPPFDE